jgi:hypothetical protein
VRLPKHGGPLPERAVDPVASDVLLPAR